MSSTANYFACFSPDPNTTKQLLNSRSLENVKTDLGLNVDIFYFYTGPFNYSLPAPYTDNLSVFKGRPYTEVIEVIKTSGTWHTENNNSQGMYQPSVSGYYFVGMSIRGQDSGEEFPMRFRIRNSDGSYSEIVQPDMWLNEAGLRRADTHFVIVYLNNSQKKFINAPWGVPPVDRTNNSLTVGFYGFRIK